ncbi:MAG: hypothetical protein U1F83_20005, partial [Verrucomicrobiota bacterium]
MRAQALPQPAKTSSPLHHRGGTRVCRERSTGLDLVVVESAPVAELHLTLTLKPGETPAVLVARLAQVLAERNATMVRQLVFGSVAAQAPTLAAMKHAFGRAVFPLTWVEGASCAGSALAGMQVHAVAGATVRFEQQANGTVACCWDDAVARHCVLNGLGPTRFAQSRA